MMNTYWRFGIKSFSTHLAYRSEVWMSTLGNFVTILIQTTIWKAVLHSSSVNGITFQTMVTYSILSTLISGILLSGVTGKVSESLRSGSIASELVKPLSYPLYLFANEMGRASYQFVFVLVPTFIVAFFYFGIKPPASAAHLAAFAAALVLSLLISFLLGYMISLIAFWFLTVFALEWTLGAMLTIFSGQFLPIWFFPSGWAEIAKGLPFQYVGYIPAALYMGYIPKVQVGTTLLLGVVWVLILFLFVSWLWWKAIKRLVVQGG